MEINFRNSQFYKPLTLMIFSFLLSAFSSFAQYTITGSFPLLAGQQVRLVGFEGFGIYTIDSTTVSEQGVFNLSYTAKDGGMGYLSTADNKTYLVVLDNENIQIKGENFSSPERIITISGEENRSFMKYAAEHPKREQVLSAWIYLQKIYRGDTLFSTQRHPQQAIETEMQRIMQEDMDFLNSLDTNTYISWYLPVRKLASSVYTVAQYRTEEIPAAIKAFRNIDYIDKRLYKSGLYKEIIDSHFWLIENSGRSSDSVYTEMNISIDYILASVAGDKDKFNEITGYLFHLLEEHSLYGASEYLALKVLTQNSCTVNNDLERQLELYRAMKIGNTAPDIVFSGDVYKNDSVVKSPERLSEIQSDYKIVLFGASWCPNCTEELSLLLPLYKKWKSKGVEVVFVSLDTDKAAFRKFIGKFPFISVCDYKKWDTQAAKDYYVFASPTLFLIDKNQKIILRPNSVKQADAWVDYFLRK